MPIAAGWRPRITGVLHAYVAVGLFRASALLDGGDHIASIVALLLVPLTLVDRRRWHWARPMPEQVNANVSQIWGGVVRLQIATIYFFSVVDKLHVEEWANGTAMYYYLDLGPYRPPGMLEPVAAFVRESPLAVLALTWGVLAIELLLAASLVLDRRSRRLLLLPGAGLHAGIWLALGLGSFSLIMLGCVVLLLMLPERLRHAAEDRELTIGAVQVAKAHQP